jgi:hypothetical protein
MSVLKRNFGANLGSLFLVYIILLLKRIDAPIWNGTTYKNGAYF